MGRHRSRACATSFSPCETPSERINAQSDITTRAPLRDESSSHQVKATLSLGPPLIASRVLPPLYDVTLIASTGEVWTLAGYER